MALISTPLPILLLLLLLPSTSTSCDPSQLSLLSSAFRSVSGFNLSHFSNCSSITDIRLPSSNLSGTVSWPHLRNITSLTSLDLSGNSLHGHISPSFWESPTLLEVNLSSNNLGGALHANGTSSLQRLDLSGNHFTSSVRLLGFSNLELLDLSSNNLQSLPEGIGRLSKLEYLDLSTCNLRGITPKPISHLSSLKHLDLSMNCMNGSFPADFPPMKGLQFLNISFNSFSGEVSADQYQKLGSFAFELSGIHRGQTQSHTQSQTSKKETTNNNKRKNKSRPLRLSALLGIIIGIAALATTAILLLSIYCLLRRRKRDNRRKQLILPIPKTWKTRTGRSASHVPSDPELTWVSDAKARAASSCVVMFEKPLMELTFLDLVAATSGFSRDSQLAEGTFTGPVFRAILPGEMHVAIKHLSAACDVDQAKVALHELASLKHPNLLPLLGYCLAGEEKLLIYQYIENGDLLRWLHELPFMATTRHVDEWPHEDASGWPIRFRIALGVARGVAYLHHAAGRRPIVHGNLDACNVLLDEDLEPRIYYSGGVAGSAAATTADDVYGYGVVLFELLSGLVGSREMVGRIRAMVKEGNGSGAIDNRILDGSESDENEMVEVLRVGYLCTAETPEKRPSMLQVVGLLKDVRPLAVI